MNNELRKRAAEYARGDKSEIMDTYEAHEQSFLAGACEALEMAARIADKWPEETPKLSGMFEEMKYSVIQFCVPEMAKAIRALAKEEPKP